MEKNKFIEDLTRNYVKSLCDISVTATCVIKKEDGLYLKKSFILEKSHEDFNVAKSLDAQACYNFIERIYYKFI